MVLQPYNTLKCVVG